MKDFRELMEIREETKIDTPYGGIHQRMFKPVQAGDFHLSIQASEHHYCSPRETLSLDEYEDMEIAIFEGKNWIQPHTDERFENFNRLSELLDRYEEGDVAVGGYVPVDLIQELCDFLETV